jgi:hypothetical protein
MTVRDALNSALDEELARDERVFIMGEEVCFALRTGVLSGGDASKPDAMAQLLLCSFPRTSFKG